jgi:hypothetical protein
MTPVVHGRALCGALAVVTAVGALSCGGPSPSDSTPPVTTTPVTTAPAPSGAAAACALGLGSVETSCAAGTPRHAELIETAINLLVREKPQLFEQGNVAIPNTDTYKVLDRETYLDGMVTNLRRQGACAERDTDDSAFERILVKTSNESSEAWDVLTPSSHVRRTWSGYLQSCSPASFPIERNSLDIPPAGSGCGRPYPPRVSRFQCKVHVIGPEFYTLDSTPMVGPNIEYCASIGFTDGRSICPLRAEGSTDREACENWRVGKAKDTGRPGPTWTNEDTGQYCTGVESNCRNSDNTQYQLYVYRSGRFRVAAESGAYCIATVER